MGLSSHTLKAISRSGELARSELQYMQIQFGFPSLDVERTLTQEGHLLRIDLRIENNGTWEADLNNLTDNLVGFQPIIKTSTYYTVTSEYRLPRKAQQGEYRPAFRLQLLLYPPARPPSGCLLPGCAGPVSEIFAQWITRLAYYPLELSIQHVVGRVRSIARHMPPRPAIRSRQLSRRSGKTRTT